MRKPLFPVVVAAAIVFGAPPAAGDPAAPSEHSLDGARVDVAAISLDDATLRLGADDRGGQPRDPDSLDYTTDHDRAGVEVGWDTGGIGPGEVFGDAVVFRLSAVDGPAGFHVEPLRLPVGDRGGAKWTFPSPGHYTLTFAVEAHTLTGEPVSAQERYTVEVRPSPEAPDTPEAPDAPPSQASLPAVEAKARPVAPRAVQPPSTTPGRITLDEGHVDAVAPRLSGGSLQLQVKDGVTVGQAGGRVHWREPADVVFGVKPTAGAALPDDPALAFLGKPGDEIFLLPQQQRAGILWTGWSTEELRADQVAGPVTLRLTTVDGPGAFGIFTTGSFGDSAVIFNSADGLPDAHTIPLGTHAHANWAFARQGVYRLTFAVTATLRGGRTVSDTEVYTFAVGNARNSPNSPNSPNNAAAGDRDDDPDLAYTGLNGVIPMTAGGVALLALGGLAVATGRKRRTR